MHNHKEEQRIAYSKLFIMFSNSIEWWLRRVIIVLLVVLLCSQYLLQFAGVRYHLTTIGKLEGQTQQSKYGH
jgi:uncharacterized membrane protein